MYRHLRVVYLLYAFKKDIVEFESNYPNCQQVKVEHIKPSYLINEMGAPTLKLEENNKDFVVVLPRT